MKKINARKVNIPIFVSHRGCLHDCVFCNQKRITGRSGSVTPAQAHEIIKCALSTIDIENTCVEIAFFGSSFTAIPVCEQEALLKVAHSYIKNGAVSGIRLSTRPDCISMDELSMLKSYGVTSIELGVQSTDEEVLEKSRRGHSYADVVCAAQMINEFGFELGLQMMLGLPGDTREKSIKTARDIIALSPKTARIYPTLIIRDSALAFMYERGEYDPISLEEAVLVCAEIYTMFRENKIEVLRMGLMASEDMCEGKGIIAGPFHPSFSELVFSRLYLLKMRDMIRGCNKKQITLRVNPRELSKALGNKRCNIETIKNEQGVKIELKCDENVDCGELLWYV
ncbi:MAG: radical SAM protein [Clostridia bacterium]|nr:radical SAM protein [Clostridia bacterium]